MRSLRYYLFSGLVQTGYIFPNILKFTLARCITLQFRINAFVKSTKNVVIFVMHNVMIRGVKIYV